MSQMKRRKRSLVESVVFVERGEQTNFVVKFMVEETNYVVKFRLQLKMRVMK
jgi:hypothetical protein